MSANGAPSRRGAAKGEPLSPVKRAIVEIRALRARLDELEQARTEPIAIDRHRLPVPRRGPTLRTRSGTCCARDVDAITRGSRGSLGHRRVLRSRSRRARARCTRAGAASSTASTGSTPQFFGISPREADSMDPQQRLLLEVAWEALEHAGQAPDRLLDERAGVFVGIGASDYAEPRAAAARPVAHRRVLRHRAAPRASRRAGSRTCSGLHGPSLAVDTACSSSLVAVHLACQSLRAGECRMALAGGREPHPACPS